MDKDAANEHISRTHLIVISIAITWYIANFLLTMLLTHFLSPNQYGNIAVVIQILNFAVPFILLGTDYSIPRFIPLYVKKKQFQHLKGYRQWNKRLLTISFIICYVVGLIAVTTALILDHYNIYSIDDYHPAIYSFWLIPLFAYWAIESSLFDAFRHYIMSTSVKLLFTLFFIAMLVIAMFIFKKLNVYYIMFIIGFCCIFLIIVLSISIRSSLPDHYTKIKPDFTHRKQWYNTSLKMMLSSIIFSGLASIDLIMLEILGYNEDAVGYLGVIIIVMGILTTIHTASSTLIMPNISLHAKKNLDYLKQLMRIIQSIKVISSIVVLIILIFLGKKILSLFGTPYLAAYHPLILLSVGLVIIMATGSSQLFLFYSGQENTIAKISLIQLALVVILDCALIPFYDIYGAIIGLLVGQWLCSIICLIIVKRNFGFFACSWRFKAPD
jgi:O-antigen/teichoic acid export membrane protein